MYAFVENWLDSILEQPIPAEVAALNFNLYEEGGNNWSIELVGTESFDLEDEDWGYDEIFDFGTIRWFGKKKKCGMKFLMK